MNSVTVQRWISDTHRDIFQNFLKPVCEGVRCWLVYAIDDAMHYDEIPLYNRGRMAFANDKTQENIRYMLNNSDFVVVTTEHIKRYYNEKYGVPLENIIAIPNLLPRWWFGDKYDPDKKSEQFRKNKAKPRIGIVSSLSHYNVDRIRRTPDGKACREEKTPEGISVWKDQDGKEVDYGNTENITDDIDDIVSTIEETMNDVQWVFFGYAPPQLERHFKSGKIQFRPGVSILNYPSVFHNLDLQAVVAPVKDMEFNRCKSHIKYMECCALGVPLFAKNIEPYSNVMEKKFLFDGPEDLKRKILDLKFMSVGAYRNMIESNWKYFNSPKKDGDRFVKNWWLEDNLDIWIEMFRLRNKGLNVSMAQYFERKKESEKNHSKNVVFKGENGVEIIK